MTNCELCESVEMTANIDEQLSTLRDIRVDTENVGYIIGYCKKCGIEVNMDVTE